MAELSPSIHDQITQLCELGERLTDAEDYAKARHAYGRAWALLPQPQEDWEAATWILAAIGDTHFVERDFQSAREVFSHAMHCPGAIGNPFLHLRLGQSQFELGNLDRAADELARAYLGAGREIFETDDAKYLAFLGTRMLPPAGEDSL